MEHAAAKVRCADAQDWATSLALGFDGVVARDVSVPGFFGEIEDVDLGGGVRVSRIASTPQRVLGPGGAEGVFKLLVQASGTAAVAQGAGALTLAPGSLAWIDGRRRFALEMACAYSQVLVRLPASLVLARHPRAGLPLPSCSAELDAGGVLLRDYATSLAGVARSLDAAARARAATALVELIGAAFTKAPDPRTALVDRALALIERDLALPELSADCVADQLRISRRILISCLAQPACPSPELSGTGALIAPPNDFRVSPANKSAISAMAVGSRIQRISRAPFGGGSP